MTGNKRYLITAATAVCLLAGAALAADPFAGSPDDLGAAPAAAAGRPFVPQRQTAREPAAVLLDHVHGYPVARVSRSTLLYDRPDGRPKLRITARTEFGSRRDLGVVRRHGDWLAVLVPELKNGALAWVRSADIASVKGVRWSLRADISRREVRVVHRGEVVRRFAIAVGRAANPTPPGRYAVTDALRVSDPGSPYGCCVLALSGHQTQLPPGWPGGDRLALHATNDLASVGQPASLGCMRMYPRDIDWLVRRIPVGAPVFVRP